MKIMNLYLIFTVEKGSRKAAAATISLFAVFNNDRIGYVV
jgi:hypothetical protein